ncbi:MAG: Maf family protein [Verrucomicrobiota bacterium]
MKIEQPLTLASASPRRRELLAMLDLDFDVVIPEIDETPLPNEKPRIFAERLAEEKACAVSANGIVIAADTIVVQNETIFGKPTDATHAREMLQTLSGSAHEVITGVCIKDAVRTEVFSVVTQVVFRILEDTEIEDYIATGEPMDKAGAYAIQNGAAHMVRSIDGSYTNVVGLPLCKLHEVLISF